MTDVIVRAVEYAVSALPAELQDHYEASTWVVRVCHRGPGDRWAVLWHGECYDAQGNHEWESSPSGRTDEFKRLFRFTLDEATGIAKALAPKVSVNGITAEKFAKGVADGTYQ